MERHRYKRVKNGFTGKVRSWLSRFRSSADEDPEITKQSVPYEIPGVSSTYILPTSTTINNSTLVMPKFETPQMNNNKSSLFEDDDFPPTTKSIGFDLAAQNDNIQWLRPHEISKTPVFSSFHKGQLFDHLDVQQGDLGDCWFLAALGSLTAHRDFFHNVVPMNQVCSGKNYTGRFQFNFFQYGEWVKVFVDDRLPTVDGKLIYTRSNDPNEFWVALLEKAYAKLNRSYENLLGGTAGEAMVDLTG